ncbi:MULTISPECIES: hypothetical protein [unclassified Legionella]|uniref:hypothetical protein n=1 Tax=unclassified Legionella TaxID=2622702 RepID=UPI001055D402|nr:MULTISPECIES: hypothetical protein [unclassified Legionella]MDI9819130.1 hypothetical protein [Legionella sp. PL877]
MKTLYEYSVALLIFGSIFIFGVFNLTLISKPITLLLGNNLSFKSTGLYLFVLNLIFIILFSCQRKMVFSQEFESFIQTLPVSKTFDRISSIFVLFISNNFLWIILLLGTYTALISQPPLMVIFETVYLISSLLIMQLSFCEKNISKFILVCIINLIFVLTKSYFSIPWFNATTALLIFLVSVLGFIDIKNTNFGIKRYKKGQIISLLTGPVLSVQCAMLKNYRSLLLTRMVLSIAFQFLSAIILIHTNENPNLIYIIMILNYITICIMSSFSRLLAIETKNMAAYFLSLPIEKHYWFKKNQVLNLILTSLILFPCTIFATWSSDLSLWMLAHIIFSITIINAVTYSINLKQLPNTTIRLSFVVLVLYIVQFFTS